MCSGLQCRHNLVFHFYLNLKPGPLWHFSAIACVDPMDWMRDKGSPVQGEVRGEVPFFSDVPSVSPEEELARAEREIIRGLTLHPPLTCSCLFILAFCSSVSDSLSWPCMKFTDVCS